MNQTLISIIIPTCNRPAELLQCLKALEAQIASCNDVEVLICDDSSDDRTKQKIEEEFSHFRWCRGPRQGPGGNRNFGTNLAKGEWLIFIDDDCLPRSTLIEAYRADIEASEPQERLILEGSTHRSEGLPSLLWEAPHNPDGGGMPSCNFAMPRWLFLEVGGFDLRFVYSFEDMEFVARSEHQNVKIRFVEEAIVDHPLRPIPNPKKLAFRWQSRVISSYDFGAKRWQVLWYLPRHVLLVILSRFRNQKLSLANLKAAAIFGTEYLIFLQRLPGWSRRFENTRSRFWGDPAQASALPKRFGL
jgi:glycosyltransferase involved in cell wall biosynthesis